MTFYHGVQAFFTMQDEGSLKWYTDSPPVLDRFKKTFLHGISGRFKCFIGRIELTPFIFSGKMGGGCLEISLFAPLD